MRPIAVRAAAAIILCAIASSSPVAAAPPFNQWVVNYGETSCIASRSFGNQAKPVILSIRPMFSGNMYEIQLAEERSAPKFAEQRRGDFDVGQGSKTIDFVNYRDDEGISVAQIVISSDELKQAGDVIRLKLEAREINVDIAPKDFAKMVGALDTCLVSLREHWQEADRLGTIAQSARGDLRKLFSSKDIPSEAMLRRDGGTASYVLLVDESGRVAGCDLAQTTGVPSLDMMGCQVILERARFTPAIDKAGKPVRDVVHSPPIRWEFSG